MVRTRSSAVPLLALVLALGGLLLAAPAQAGALDDAKDAGWVGERRDGFVGLVRRDAPDDVKALVEEINRKRRATYERIAERRGTTVVAVAALAGEKLIREAPDGHFVQDPEGDWVRK